MEINPFFEALLRKLISRSLALKMGLDRRRYGEVHHETKRRTELMGSWQEKNLKGDLLQI